MRFPDHRSSRLPAAMLLVAILAPLVSLLALSWHVSSAHRGHDHHPSARQAVSHGPTHVHGHGEHVHGTRHHHAETTRPPDPPADPHGLPRDRHRHETANDHRHGLLITTGEGLRAKSPESPVLAIDRIATQSRIRRPDLVGSWIAAPAPHLKGPPLSHLCVLLL